MGKKPEHCYLVIAQVLRLNIDCQFHDFLNPRTYPTVEHLPLKLFFRICHDEKKGISSDHTARKEANHREVWKSRAGSLHYFGR